MEEAGGSPGTGQRAVLIMTNDIDKTAEQWCKELYSSSIKTQDFVQRIMLASEKRGMLRAANIAEGFETPEKQTYIVYPSQAIRTAADNLGKEGK